MSSATLWFLFIDNLYLAVDILATKDNNSPEVAANQLYLCSNAKFETLSQRI